MSSNPKWDQVLAETRMRRLEIPLHRRVGKLSGGQQAQVALALALGKRPELLLLDEPVANLDPVARRQFLAELMELVAVEGLTVVLSSHLIADLERVADHLVILASGRLQVAGDLEPLLENHRWLVGPTEEIDRVGGTIVQNGSGERQCRMLVRTPGCSSRMERGPGDPRRLGNRLPRKPGCTCSRAARGCPGMTVLSGATWLAWRNNRQAAVVGGVLAFGAAAALVVVAFLETAEPAGSVHTMSTAFRAVLIGAPGVAGVFIGAPLLSADFERGTYLLTWTQGITRRHWTAANLFLLTGLFALAAAAMSVGAQLWIAHLPNGSTDVGNVRSPGAGRFRVRSFRGKSRRSGSGELLAPRRSPQWLPPSASSSLSGSPLSSWRDRT